MKKVVVYTLPVCPNCHALKKWLSDHGVVFIERDLENTEVMAELVMRDVFVDSTPAMEAGGEVYMVDTLFVGDRPNERFLKRLLGVE